MEISKVVIPAAGVSARFLPYSKSIPREMLPLVQKPAIQYIAEESLLSNLTNFLIITARYKDVIADHFDNHVIEPALKSLDKIGHVSAIEKIARQAQLMYFRQLEQQGLGHAVWLTRATINKEYFAVALPDDIIVGKQPALAQLIRVARQEKASIVAVQEVPSELVSSYGIVGIKKMITPNLFQLSHIVEKPQPKDAPSAFAIVGRYVLSSKIFQSLEELMAYEVNELNLSDAISHMMQNNERVFAFKVSGTHYDVGTPLGWLKAQVRTALADPELGPGLKKFLQELNSTDQGLYNPAKIIENTL